MAAQLKKKLKAALEKFDVAIAEKVLDDVHAAELAGYELTAQEENFCERLINCVQRYYKNLALLQ